MLKKDNLLFMYLSFNLYKYYFMRPIKKIQIKYIDRISYTRCRSYKFFQNGLDYKSSLC